MNKETSNKDVAYELLSAGQTRNCPIYWAELQDAEPGDEWRPYPGEEGDDNHYDYAIALFADTEGVLLRVTEVRGRQVAARLVYFQIAPRARIEIGRLPGELA